MTPSQILKWLSDNNKIDQWWVSVDGVVKDDLVTFDKIEEIIENKDYSELQVLHVSQGEAETPWWIRVEEEAEPTNEHEIELPNQKATLPLPSRDVISQGGKRHGCMTVLVILIAGFFLLFRLATCGGSSSGDSEADTDPRVSGEYTIDGDFNIGFVHYEDFERSTELAVSDLEATEKFNTACLLTGNATLFRDGEVVILDKTKGFLATSVKIRRKGELVSYWTYRETIK